LKNHETELVSLGNFDGLRKAQTIDPERENGFDFCYKEDGSEFFDGHCGSPVKWDSLIQKAADYDLGLASITSLN
jgi:hypothetical protein